MMEIAVPDRRKRNSQGESRWIWREKTWKELELRRETKSIGTNGKYYRALATPKWERPQKEEEMAYKWKLAMNFVDWKNQNKPISTEILLGGCLSNVSKQPSALQCISLKNNNIPNDFIYITENL